MSTLAGLVFNSGSFVAWTMVGLITGWLASKVLAAPTYGMIGDLFLGPIGAVAGGLVSGLFLQGDFGFWGSVLVAFVGACIFVVAAHSIALNRRV